MNYYLYGLPFNAKIQEHEILNKYLYQGNETLDSLGWYNFHDRMYSAELGRFLAIDPAGQFHSPYNGMGNNPVMVVDPSGEFGIAGMAILAASIGYTMYNNHRAGYSQERSLANIGITIGTSLASYGVGSLLGGVGSTTVGNSVAATELTRAGAHATISGVSSGLSGGDFWNGFAVGGFSSLAGSGLELTNIGGVGMVAGSAAIGGISAEIGGGEFWHGVLRGGVIAGVNHLAHSASSNRRLETKSPGPGFFPKRSDYPEGKWGDFLFKLDVRLTALGLMPGPASIASAGSNGGTRITKSIFSLITKKIIKQMSKRGWSKVLIHETVNNPYTTRFAINKATGNPATAYYRQNGSYVVKDNITNEIIQISNRYDPGWLPDPSIINPFLPKN